MGAHISRESGYRGALILVNKNMKLKPLTHFEAHSEEGVMEVCGITGKKSKITILAVYRPLRGSMETFSHKMRVCLEETQRKTVRNTLEPKVLKDEERRSLYEEHLNKELESIRSINDTNEHWLKLKEAFTETNEIFLTNTGRRTRNKRMTETF
ncbi:hypothetical protein HHI36_002011 [Cryptolaemus montrouzieri]|uniref:Uncharacterized protein n=1 Tax=Cryptolaemus montrouzieri TaxID=559131 RepID=A0ABD2PA10_9CUCU